jgi:hypothetical protein
MGPPQISPGQRPGWRLPNLRQSPERATHRRSAVAPLQGFFPRFFAVFRVPRALSWAVLSGPFGAKIADRATSKSANEADIESVVGEFRTFLETAVAGDGKGQSTILEIK